MHQRVAPAGVARQRARQARNRAQNLGHLHAHRTQLGQAVFGLGVVVIPHRRHAAQEGMVFEGQCHDARFGFVADAQVQRQRRQELVVRRARAQQLDRDLADADVLAHGALPWVATASGGLACCCCVPARAGVRHMLCAVGGRINALMR